MIDRYYIGAYWGDRRQSVKEIAIKSLETLLSLKRMHSFFSSWYQGASSRKKALKLSLRLELPELEQIVAQSVKKDELDKNGFSENGFVFGFWTGHEDEYSSSISFNVGKSFGRLNNSCVLSFPFEGDVKTQLLHQEFSILIIKSLIEIWNPEYAVLTSHFTEEIVNYKNRIGWVTYKIGKSVNIDTKSFKCESFNQGEIIASNFEYTKENVGLLESLKRN